MTDTVALGPLELGFHAAPGSTGGFLKLAIAGQEQTQFAVTRAEWGELVALAERDPGDAPWRGRLAAFLFRTLRDDLPTGVVERQVECVEAAHRPDDPNPIDYDPPALGAYAQDLAERLVP
jgi:hypothetical protein